MIITAQLNYLRIAPRKVRLAAHLLKGMDVVQAENQLKFLVKRSGVPLAKLLKSAIANAENNFGLLKENLYIKDIRVNEGVKLKRFMPRAMGQAGMIQKKTSHLKLTLEEKVAGLKMKRPNAEIEPQRVEPLSRSDKGEEGTSSQRRAWKVSTNKPTSVSGRGVFGGVKDISRKLFRRKSV